MRTGTIRASGQLAASEEAEREIEKMDEMVEPTLPEERATTFRTPGFSRMRFNWKGDDAPVIAQAKAAVDGRIIHNFIDAYEVMFQVYDLVRTPLVDTETGEIEVDQWGFKLWKKNPSGSYEEDWSKLTLKQKEHFLFTITTRLFDWEQRAGEVWMEAMFAKAQFEEKFSIDFDTPMSGTVEDRRAVGNLGARDERYFAIFLSAYSRRVDALVRTLGLLAQRIKDSMV